LNTNNKTLVQKQETKYISPSSPLLYLQESVRPRTLTGNTNTSAWTKT
jgi:hypothetical protein